MSDDRSERRMATRRSMTTAPSLPLLIAYRICQGFKFVSFAASLIVTRCLSMALTARSTSWNTFLQWGEQNSWLFLTGSKLAPQCWQSRTMPDWPPLRGVARVWSVSTAGMAITREVYRHDFRFGVSLSS